MRSANSTQGTTVLLRLAQNSYVWVIEEKVNSKQEVWSKVIYSGRQGWIMTRYINLLSQSASSAYEAAAGTRVPDAYRGVNPTTPTPTQIPVITASPLYSDYAVITEIDAPLYQLPDSQSYPIEVLSRGDVVQIVRSTNTAKGVWHLIMFSDLSGYLPDEVLRRMTQSEFAEWQYGNSSAPAGSGFGYVGAYAVSMRAGASTDSERVAILRQYAFCQVLGTEDSAEGLWVHVLYNGLEGYINAEYFTMLAEADVNRFLMSNEYQEGLRNNPSR